MRDIPILIPWTKWTSCWSSRSKQYLQHCQSLEVDSGMNWICDFGIVFCRCGCANAIEGRRPVVPLGSGLGDGGADGLEEMDKIQVAHSLLKIDFYPSASFHIDAICISIFSTCAFAIYSTGPAGCPGTYLLGASKNILVFMIFLQA